MMIVMLSMISLTTIMLMTMRNINFINNGDDCKPINENVMEKDDKRLVVIS